MTVPSETMMDLLKELAVIKQLDEKYESGPRSELEISEFEKRQNRRQEIADRIKALGESAE